MLEKIKHRLSRLTHEGEPWIHSAYCAVLYVEGHGLYAMIGGVLGLFVLANIIPGD